MPVLANAKKALRKDRRRTVVNRRVKDKMKAAVKAVRESKKEADLPKAFQTIDRAVKRNLLHWKKAGRLKSQLSKIVEKTTTTKKSDTKTTKKVAKTSTTKPKKATKAKSSPKKTTK